MLSALIQNFDTVEEAIEASAGSAGSALEENERYLDSIQGKIDQFTNATQSMWSNFLDADVVKFVVELGARLIKVVDTLGLIPSILVAIGSVKGLQFLFKGFSLTQIVQDISALTMGTKMFSAETTKATMAMAAESAQFHLANSALIEYAVKMGLATSADVAKMTTTQLLGLSFKALGVAIWGSVKAITAFLLTNPVGWVILAVGAIAGGIAAWNKWGNTTENLQEKLEDLKSEISDMGSELEELNSELKTTQDRMEELLSKDSLSFVEEEELKNLQLQNELLEKKIKLQEMLLKNKIKEANKAAEDVINDSWGGTKLDKKYAISTYDLSSKAGGASIIKEDDMWSNGVSGKEALETSIASYIARKGQADVEERLYLKVLEEMEKNDGQLSDELISKVEDELEYNRGFFEDQYGYVTTGGIYDEVASAKNVAEHIKSALEGNQEINDEALRMQEEGIEMVLGDLLEQIPEDYEYGSSDIIDQAFDELSAYQLKYENAQGKASKSEIINTIFGAGASEELQSLEEELREIASSEDDVATKTKNAQGLIQKAYESTNDGYKRLKNSIDIVDISVEELAKSFIATSEAADLGTIGGILRVFAGGEEILNNFKDGLKDVKLGMDEAGEAVTWNNLFDGPQGSREAYGLKVSSILKGADESVREQFTKLIEEVENGKMGIDEALSRWKMVGADKAVEALNTEFEALNNEMFPDAADEISGLIDTLSELKSAFESVASTMDTFKSAQEEYNNTGRVSIKTALELMSSTDDWNEVLKITEDSITLIPGAEKALMESQLKSIAEQMQTAADMAKIKLEAAENAQKAKEAFDAEANAANNLSATEQNVNTTQQNANITTQQRTGAMGSLAEQTYGTAISELDYAANDSTVQTAESVKAKAIGLVSAAIVGLDAFIDALLTDKTMKEAWSEYQEARNVVIDDANSKTTTVDQLRKDYEKKQAMANVAKNGDTYGEFGTNWDGNDDEKEKANDAFQKEMDYWENRIAANQAKYEQIQNEIDLMEAKGQKANAAYYQEQITLENQRMRLLQGQKKAAKEYLATLEEGSEEWWSTAEVLNGLESEIDDVTASIVDLQDAIDEINVYKFDEYNTRLDNITSKLGTIRDLIAPNGEEDWFDDEGNWTESGVAVLGTYLQDLETYKQGYQKTVEEMAKYAEPYEGNENYYETLGIHSEQEYYDKVESLTDQQYDYAKSISDTEQSVVDMYESSIDVVEEYVNTLIDGYNDYIDSVKEALDAERKLYDFKKNVEKQAKDIAEIERRIASLSGSTNKADIAERRKLEAQLYESRESLNDTYYDHAKDSQNEALDAEATAYEETMTRMVEGMRTSLQEATADMDTFLNNVTIAVSMNADTVLEKYRETNVYLDPALTNPWENAKTKVGEYGDKATNLMDVWKKDGYFADFSTTAGTNLSSPWSSGTSAANAFKSSVDTVMDDVVTKIDTNIQKASGELSKLYQQIQDIEKKATNINVTQATDTPKPQGTKSPTPTYNATATYHAGSKTIQASSASGSESSARQSAINSVLDKVRKYYMEEVGWSELQVEKAYSRWKQNIAVNVTKYAKGTTGAPRDQWAITDEPRFGDELVLVPGKDGNLSFMRKGTGVVPADLTANLMEWGQFTPDSMNLGSGVNVNMINNAVNKPEFNFTFDALVKAERIDENTLPEVKRFVQQEINSLVKQMNYAIKGKGGR